MYSDAIVTSTIDGERVQHNVTTGSIFYIGNEETPMMAVFFEGKKSLELESTTEEIYARGFSVSSRISSSCKSTKINDQKIMTATCDNVLYVQVAHDNTPPGGSLASKLKEPKNKDALSLGAFGDPAKTLEDFRTTEDAQDHKDLFLLVNKESMYIGLVKPLYPGQRGSSDKAKELSSLTAMSAELSYEVIVEGKSPIVSAEDRKVWQENANLLALEVVVKLGLVDALKEKGAPSARTKENENQKKRKAKHRKDSQEAEGSVPPTRVRLKVPPGFEGPPEAYHKNMDKLKLNGEPYRKPGRKAGTSVNPDGTVCRPAMSSRPAPQQVSAAPITPCWSQVSGVELVNNALVEELRGQLAAQTAMIDNLEAENSALKKTIAEFATAARVKETQLQGEMKIRKNTAALYRSIAASNLQGLAPEDFSEVSPLKIPAVP